MCGFRIKITWYAQFNRSNSEKIKEKVVNILPDLDLGYDGG